MVIELLRSRLEYSNGELFWKTSGNVYWDRKLCGKEAGTASKKGYIHIKLEGKVYKAHRLVWAIVNGEFPDGMVDHINGDKTDNRIENLRVVTSSQNSMNRRPIGVYKGVVETPSGKFKARIRVKNSWIDLKLWGSAKEAAEAYNKAAVQYFGDYALLNKF